jgi:hypothetical protein
MRSKRGVELEPLFHYDRVKAKGGQYRYEQVSRLFVDAIYCRGD